MGVDCRIVLPGRVRVKDVARIIGICAGLPATRDNLSVDVEGLTMEPSSLLGLVEIHLTAQDGKRLIDGETYHWVLYHFEGSHGALSAGGMRYEIEGVRLMLPPSTAFWIAVGTRLVSFFGGWLDYSDHDNVSVDYTLPERENIAPSDGEAWSSFWDQIASMKPLTKAELEAAKAHAAY